MPRKLVVNDRAYFVSVVRAAKQIGGPAWESFKRCLTYLCQPAEGSVNAQRNAEIRLYKDWSPLSFEFVVIGFDGKRVFNGGLIYHPARSNGMAEGSIVVDPVDHANWSLHT